MATFLKLLWYAFIGACLVSGLSKEEPKDYSADNELLLKAVVNLLKSGDRPCAVEIANRIRRQNPSPDQLNRLNACF